MSQDTGNDLADEGIKPAQTSSNPPTASINEILEDAINLLSQLAYALDIDEEYVKSKVKTALYTLIADKVIGADEPQCDCETDPDGLGYHGKWCEQNGLYYGLLRNELKAEQRKILKELFDE